MTMIKENKKIIIVTENIGGKIYRLVLWICPAVSFLVAAVSYSYALGYQIDVGGVVHVFVGVIFILIGNYLPKCRQNYTVGIKIPWTIDDEDNWNKTHRMAGILWMFAGIVMIANLLFQSEIIMFSAIIICVAVPVIYSYILYVKKNK